MRAQLGELRFEKCILCLENPADSWEHMIPSSLGGEVEYGLLCNQCNRKMGRTVVASAKSDPAVRLALEQIQAELPELYERMTRNLLFSAGGHDDKPVKIVRKDGAFRVMPRPIEQNSHLQDPRDAKKELIDYMKKENYTDDEMKPWLDKLDNLKPDESGTFPGGRTLVMRRTGRILPDLRGGLLDERFPALVAYEFLALSIGKTIYDPAFDELRAFIQRNEPTERFKVERFGSNAPKHATQHQIHIVRGDSNIQIDIYLFRKIVFTVTFERIVIKGIPDSVYIEDVGGRQTLLALTREEYEKGEFYVIRDS